MESNESTYPTQMERKQPVPESERGGFASKVFGILGTQLLITSIFCVFGLTDYGSDFFLNNIWLGIVMVIIAFITLLIFACYPQYSRSIPINYVILFTFTIAGGYTLGLICSLFTSASVLFAIVLCTIISLSLCIYAIQAKEDYSTWRNYMMVLTMGFFAYIVACIFIGSSVISPFLSTLAAVLFSLYLVMDVQMIMNNEQSYYDIDDYILASMSIYLDVVTVFVYLLQLVAQRR